MPVTYPPGYYGTRDGVDTKTSTYNAMRDFVWFLNGTHPSKVNPTTPWPVIDCYDAGLASRSTSLVGDWTSGTSEGSPLVQFSWCTLQAPASNVTNRFQLYIKMETFGAASINICMLDDWSVGAGPAATPTLPSTILSQPPGTGGIDGRISNHGDEFEWTAVVDEGTILLLVASASSNSEEWLYVGEFDPDNPGSTDPRPFVYPVNALVDNWATGNNYRTISIVDDSTIVNVRSEVEQFQAFNEIDDQDAFSTRPLSSVAAYADSTNNRYRIGKFRNVGAAGRFVGATTTATRTAAGYTGSDNRFEIWGPQDNNAKIVILNQPETALDQHQIVSELSVPTQLIPPASGGGDVTLPVVTFVDPTPGSTIRSNSRITVDVTDDSGAFSGVQLRVQYNSAVPSRATETIHGGDTLGEFEPLYLDCTVRSVTDGFRFVLIRTTGWPSTPTFVATPVDRSGNTI